MARVSAAADTKTETAAEQEHQVLYRKFRPRQFADVVGQDHIIKPLQGMVERNKVGHAFLFVGPRGCGKTTTARLLSMAMNCPNVSDAGEPCGECGTCKGIINGSGAIGLHELDAASKRGVGDMNSLIETMAMGSVARKKVYIIDECHMLTNEASNALLKTLEEPPADTLIILCTTEVNKVLPTIKSRAVTYNFKTVSAELMTSLVREIVDAAGIEIDAAGIAEVVRRGNGSPRDTLTALEGFGGDTEAATSDFVPKIAAAVADRDATALVVTIAEVINSGIGIPDFSRSLLEHWRNCLLSLQAPAALNLTGEALRQVEIDAKALKTNKVMRLLNVTSEALSKMNSSTDTRLLLETTLLQVSLPETADTLDGIYDYLDDIMAAVKRLSKEVKSGVAVQQPSAWPPVSGDATPAIEDADVEPEPVHTEPERAMPEPDADPVEGDADEDQSGSNDSDDSSEEVSTDKDEAPEVAETNESEDDLDASDDDESDESGYESYDDAEDDGVAESEASDDDADRAEVEQDQDEASVKDISQLFGDDEDEVSDEDEPVIAAESDRDRKRRERRERREREERGEAEPETEDESAPEQPPVVVPGDFHNDDDPNCDCTRCQDEVAEYEQRALKEVREREKREAEEKKPQTKLRLVPNDEPKAKPARAKKVTSEKVFSQEECPTAATLVDMMDAELVSRQIARYLAPSAVEESLRGDVLVLTVKPKTKLVFTDEVVETIRATADNLWVSDIEIVV